MKDRYRSSLDSPGGAIDPGESIQVAAVREVKEETGIDVQFKGLLAMVNRVEANRYKMSNYFFHGLATPKNPDQPLQAQENEIEILSWYDVDDIVGKTSDEVKAKLGHNIGAQTKMLLDWYYASSQSTMAPILDYRQQKKKAEDQDLNDLMWMHFFQKVRLFE